MACPTDTLERLDAPSESEPATRYVDEGKLAKGGSATLHAVLDTQLDRALAMKRMLSNAAGSPAERDRFVREARVTARLEHPGIVPVHELGQDPDGCVWFTMKRVHGRTFDHVFRRDRDLRALVEALLRICDTVAYAHSCGVIHRDIKPANVMLGSFGEVYLMDWGSALVDGDEAPPGVEGTPCWIAPEQAQEGPIDARVDVYGIGGLLYFALCGAKPHPGADSGERIAHARTVPVLSPHRVRAALPPELCRIAMRALAFDPADRYATVAALRADLSSALRHGWWLEMQEVPADTLVVREGDEGDAAWIIEEGRAQVWQGGAMLTELGPGDAFGEMALLSGEPRSATVYAITPLVLRVIHGDVFEAALADAWHAPILRSLARRLRARDRD